MIVGLKDLPKIRIKHSADRAVFCSGSFDIPHVAHALFFEDCKCFGDILMVCVGGDSVLKSRKPGRPIMSEVVRLKMIDFLKPVDYCYLDTVSTPEDPLAALAHAFENLRPDVYVVKDEAFDMDERRELCVRFGIRMEVLHRDFETGDELRLISTSSIIERIKNAATEESE